MSSNNYWTDRRQNERIEEAEAQLVSERRARNRLAQQMREQQGNLEGQIKRLTTALVALIEHEDIRAELGQYADAAACRRYAQEVVATVIATGGAALRTSTAPPQMHGYWLSSAALGVAAIAQGEAGGSDLLADARQSDPRRTQTFLALLGAATRDPRWVDAGTASVLPAQAAATAAERQLWLAITEGRLTCDSLDLPEALVGALGRAVGSGDATAEAVATWLEETTPVTAGALPAERATAQLARLRAVLGSGLGSPEPVADSHRKVEPDPAAPGAEAPAEDPLADCLRSLVDEGSPGEADILDRMAQARTDLGFLDERAASLAAGWAEPTGQTVDHLLADLGEPPDTPRRGLAVRVLTPALRELADALAQQSATPPTDHQLLQVAGEAITVVESGATTDWHAGVRTGVLRRNPRPAHLPWLGLAAIAAGLAGIGLAFVSSGFIFLAIVGIVVGGGILLSDQVGRRDLVDLQESTIRSTERKVQDAMEQITDQRERSAAALSRATDEHAGVHQLLA